MPIYEYQCNDCEHVFDVLQKMSEDPLTYCPECGKPELRKLLSAPNFRLKGGGWYETDFKNKNQRNLAGSSDASGGSSGSTDSKGSAGSTGSSDSAGTKSTKSAKSAGSASD